MSFAQRRYIPDEGVDPNGVHVVRLLQGLLDLTLVRLAVNNEHKSVDLLDLLHRALGVQGEQKHLVRVSARSVGGALARVFRVARETQRLGAVERRRGANRTQALLTRLTLLHNLLGDVGLPRSRLLVSSRRHGNGQLGCVEDRARGVPSTKGARICTVSRVGSVM